MVLVLGFTNAMMVIRLQSMQRLVYSENWEKLERVLESTIQDIRCSPVFEYFSSSSKNLILYNLFNAKLQCGIPGMSSCILSTLASVDAEVNAKVLNDQMVHEMLMSGHGLGLFDDIHLDIRESISKMLRVL